MRSVSNAFLDFQLTALFDKIIPAPHQIKDIAPVMRMRNSDSSRAAAI